MADLPSQLLVHTVDVQTLTGSGAYGDVFAATVTVPAWIEEKRRLVRNTLGDQVVSEATIRTAVAHADLFSPGSLVTLHTELSNVALRSSRVISEAFHTDGGAGAWQHLEVTV